MTINDAASILVIIVSAVLVLFLIVAIVATILVAKLVNSARGLVHKAEEFVDSAESAAEALKNVGGPLAAFKLIRNIVKMINKVKK
jgi:predicted PurR-regulated permease PerM